MKLPSFKIEDFFAKYEFKSQYLLCCSDCESYSIEELLSMEMGAMEKFQRHWLGYTETHGNPELREEIATLYKNNSAENILVQSGTEETIFVFMNVALNPEDHVIIHFPCYGSLIDIPRQIGCEITPWTANEENGWSLDINFLERNIKENTRAIIMNLPHNPSGYLMEKNDYLQVVELARKHNLLIFSDEIYRLLEYNREDRLPPACDLYENAISTGGTAKVLGLAGLRIGWIATQNKSLIDQMASYKNYLTICSSAPSEFLATIALRQREKILQRNLDIVFHNLQLLDEFFERYQNFLQWHRPTAGPIAFPGFRQDIDAHAFSMELLAEQDVLLLPSEVYDFDRTHFRIGFGRKNIPECLERLDSFLMKKDVEVV